MDNGPGVLLVLLYLVVCVFYIATWWKIFTKAGKPGWAILVPFYNIIVGLQIINRPAWWIILYLIPVVNIVIFFIVMMDFAECFGKSRAWGFFMLGILGVVGSPILGFGEAKYSPPSRPA